MHLQHSEWTPWGYTKKHWSNKLQNEDHSCIWLSVCNNLTVANPGEQARGPVPPPLIFRPNWGPKSPKKLGGWHLPPPPPLSQGLDPAMSEHHKLTSPLKLTRSINSVSGSASLGLTTQLLCTVFFITEHCVRSYLTRLWRFTLHFAFTRSVTHLL